MVKIFTKEITKCRQCPNHDMINMTTGDMLCDLDDKPKHIIKYDNDYVPSWCKLPDKEDETEFDGSDIGDHAPEDYLRSIYDKKEVK
jgi:hypothetical protein